MKKKKEKKVFFIFRGSWGTLTSNPSERKFQGSKTSSQSRHTYNKGKNNNPFFIYGPQYIYFCIFGYSGGPVWPKNNRTGPIFFLPSYPLPAISLHIKYGSNPISYRENDDVSADAAAAAATDAAAA